MMLNLTLMRVTLKQVSRCSFYAVSVAGIPIKRSVYQSYTLSASKLYLIVSAILKEGLAGLMTAKPSFCLTATKILRPVLV